MINKKCIIPTLFALALLAGCSSKKTQNETSLTGDSPPSNTTTETMDKVTEAEKKPEGPLPIISFKDTLHDFGTIEEGEKISYGYSFTNTGDAPLIIQSARPACGCTVPAWSKDPVPVGGTGFVKVEFDSKGRSNVQNKTVTVTANTWPKTTVLRFKVMVTPKSRSSK